MLALLLRLPFLTTPLNVDEGGYATIAWQWSQGARLYHDVWVDRPQGMLVLYRGLFAVFGSNGWAVRGFAAAWAVLGVVAVASVARSIGGARAGVIAAFAFAVLSATPRAEGFAANGELLAAVPSVACVALVLAARRRTTPAGSDLIGPLPARWVVAAGICGALAVVMKQSGFDGALAVLVWLLVSLLIGARRGGETVRSALRALALLAAGAAIVVVPTVLHGASLGIDDWWFAVVGQRSSSQSVWTGGLDYRLERLAGFVEVLRPVLAAIALLLVAGPVALVVERFRSGRPRCGVAADARRDRPVAGATVLLSAWTVAAGAGFLAGGLFHPHYVIGLAPVLSVLGALSLDRLARCAPAPAALLGCACLLGLGLSAWPSLSSVDPLERSRQSSADQRIVTDAEVAAYLRAHTAPTDRIFAMYANAGLYVVADRPPASPYLWRLNLEEVPGAIDELAAVFNGAGAPRYVAVYAAPDSLRGGGAVADAFGRRYRLETHVAGVPIYRLTA